MTRAVRPIRIEGDVAYVTLTRGYEAIIDAADVPLVEGFNWCVNGREPWLYAVRINNKNKILYMHRMLMCFPESLFVDHIDGNSLNNRRANLRLATMSQNVQNSRKQHRNASGFKGAVWSKQKSKWIARIRHNNVLHYLGSFDTPEAAHSAYVAASEVMFGEFARAA